MFFSTAPWAATAYLGSYLVLGPLLFGIALTVLATAVSLSIIWVTLPLLAAAALVIRGCAQIERARAALAGVRIAVPYQQITRTGLMAQIKTRWRDPATYRDCSYLFVLFGTLMLLDAVAFAVWVSFVAMITLPLWYWSIPHTWEDTGVRDHGVMIGYLPHGPHMSDGGFGVWIGTLPAALATAAVFLVLSCFAAYLVVGAARTHAAVARGLLGPRVDPLWQAKQVLTEAGPLRLQ